MMDSNFNSTFLTINSDVAILPLEAYNKTLEQFWKYIQS